MSIEIARRHLNKYGLAAKIIEFPVSSATVELAAQAAGVAPARICKTLSFKTDSGGLLLQTAGDTRVDNGKFKQAFGMKAKMLSPEEVVLLTGHAIGGVCAFGVIDDTVKIYADISLKRFQTVYPACGSDNSAIELTPDELYRVSESIGWVDVCKDWIADT
jgi:prolyl-tRNA editing enzyme YbaK/EbsC (Cys-tRNA(Pro) deacylase)